MTNSRDLKFLAIKKGFQWIQRTSECGVI